MKRVVVVLGVFLLLILVSFLFIPYERGGVRQCLANPETGAIFCPGDPLLWFGQPRGVVFIAGAFILIVVWIRRSLT